MACFYAMHEMEDVPFTRVSLRGGTSHEYLGEKRFPNDGILAGHTYPEFDEHGTKCPDRSFYTLRVCKRCRGDWMQAIRKWFVTPLPRVESCGSGIFVREHGAIVEITEEEWRERHGDHVEPAKPAGELWRARCSAKSSPNWNADR